MIIYPIDTYMNTLYTNGHGNNTSNEVETLYKYVVDYDCLYLVDNISIQHVILSLLSHVYDGYTNITI